MWLWGKLMKDSDSSENQPTDRGSTERDGRVVTSVANTEELLNQIKNEPLLNDVERKLPPVHLWEPDNCGTIDIKITRDGRWFHEGKPIVRQSMVKMFSRILRHDEDFYYLVTPVEKMRIEVEDAPFVAVAVEVQGQGSDQILSFKTNVGDVTAAGLQHPIRVDIDPETLEPRPYVHVRANLEALISRPVFYELAAIAVQKEVDYKRVVGVFSGGEFYSFGPYE